MIQRVEPEWSLLLNIKDDHLVEIDWSSYFTVSAGKQIDFALLKELLLEAYREINGN